MRSYFQEQYYQGDYSTFDQCITARNLPTTVFVGNKIRFGSNQLTLLSTQTASKPNSRRHYSQHPAPTSPRFTATAQSSKPYASGKASSACTTTRSSCRPLMNILPVRSASSISSIYQRNMSTPDSPSRVNTSWNGWTNLLPNLSLPTPYVNPTLLSLSFLTPIRVTYSSFATYHHLKSQSFLLVTTPKDFYSPLKGRRPSTTSRFYPTSLRSISDRPSLMCLPTDLTYYDRMYVSFCIRSLEID